MIKKIAILLLMITFLCSCALVHARKIPVQQGNQITQKEVNQLKPGMSPDDVKRIMGPPLLTNIYASDTLYYVYTLNTDKQNISKHLVLSFKQDRLIKISGTAYPQ